MPPATVLLFAGQGSQQFRMARQVLASSPAFRRVVSDLDRVVRSDLGVSVVADVFCARRGAHEPMLELKLSHPALFIAQVALAECMQAAGLRPDCVLGASLGEIVALVVAGVLEPIEGLRIVLEQVDVLERLPAAGGMLAVLGDANRWADALCAASGAELAAVNSRDHFVVSGDRGGIDAAIAWSKERGLPHLELPVRYGFHSSAIDGAAAWFAERACSYRCALPLVAVASCLDGDFRSRYEPHDLWRIVREPIRVSSAIGAVEAAMPGACYIDLSPGGTMGNIVRRSASGASARVKSVLSPIEGPCDFDVARVSTVWPLAQRA